MTREEAIETLGHVVPFATQNGEKIAEAIDMAIEAIRHDVIFEQIKWERDVALQTLEEHGIGLGQKCDAEVVSADAVEVVRCKECFHRVHDEERGLYYCEKYYGQGDVSDENFCQWGERKEP